MLKSIHLEFKKMKYRKIGFLLFGFCLLLLAWMSYSIHGNQSNITKDGFLLLLYEIPIMNTILLPIVIAVIASRIWDIEYKRSTYKVLFSMQTKDNLYLSKTILGCFYLFILCALECLICIILAMQYHFKSKVPLGSLIYLCFFTFIVCCMLYFLQQILSFYFDNQVMGLSLGLIGSFLGLFSILFARNFQKFIFWSYFCLLSNVSMHWNPTTRAIHYYHTPISIFPFIFIAFISLIFFIFGYRLFLRKEI